jgi:glycosyltransferase involved in cell wall biosynthesis
MHLLFIHRNFPAQFRYLAPRLAQTRGWSYSYATARTDDHAGPGGTKVVYRAPSPPRGVDSRCAGPFECAVAHARGVYEALKRRPDVKPDLVVAHSGLASSLYVSQLYDCPVVNFFECFFRPVGQDFGYRPEAPVTEWDLLRGGTRNGIILIDLHHCDQGWSPSEYQRALFPAEFQHRIEVIPEGVDTDRYAPRPSAERKLPDGTLVPAATRVITYVSRGLELMRGFDVFMKAAKLIYQRFPDVLFVVVGADKVYYGNDAVLTGGKSFREHVLAGDDYDLSKFRFTGFVPEADLVRILGLSDLHIYLTAPFITSWSMLDAMSCGCVVLASEQACTREYITHARNGLLCDFFDAEGIAEQAVRVLKDPAEYRVLGDAARIKIEEEYSLDMCLPKIKAMFERVVAKGRPGPSVRAEKLVHAGALAIAKGQGDGEKGRQEEGETRGQGDEKGEPNVPLVPLSPCPLVSFTDPPRAGPVTPGTVLLLWELGDGLGHLMQLLPVARGLARRGHRVYIALPKLNRAAADVFGRAGVRLLQSPVVAPARAPFPQALGYAHLLANLGFHDGRELLARACAWRRLFELIRPDATLVDHGPTTLLAARGLPMHVALIGSGFCCPPQPADASEPWGVFRRGASAEQLARLLADERQVLARVNRALAAWNQPPLSRVAELYLVDANFLTTFPELEQFPGRPGGPLGLYWGPVLDAGDGGPPPWPDAPGKRLLAYLKWFDGLDPMLEALRRSGQPTLVYVPGLTEAGRKRRESATLRLAPSRVDLRRAAAECDGAVLHAGQGATAALLLAGKPILQIPLVLEQRLTADATARRGAGLVVNDRAKDPASAGRMLDELLTDDR